MITAVESNAGAAEWEIDDAIETEEIFSTLMGESVEARRKFIGDKALDVTNLDI